MTVSLLVLEGVSNSLIGVIPSELPGHHDTHGQADFIECEMLFSEVF